ncbi:SusC/RagA family TonB-linked outer membrane protein [Chondrinema litorale]|uniref:SusC/RagA family TonB-linked outer membrane protein n=1 Tax=Chondrinema litorale TaxID=2994555 RepID=UPI0025432405|nr:SusC/RagA family TonB-linked outer membrane protein [Chondrinema litorale]UZR97121.1 SusC/RagA family TonB-linked outer membrane protein [Chondrinema litorale]
MKDIIRKILLIQVILCLYSLDSSVLGQNSLLNKRISIHQNGSIQEILNTISNENGITFSYSDNLLPLEKKVDIQKKAITLSEILKELFKGTGIEFKESTNMILLRMQTKKNGQQIIGKVIDIEGNPLPGASILVKGTKLGTISNTNGKFGLRMPSNQHDSLVVSFIGMKTQYINVAIKTQVTITMVEDLKNLEELIVTGYNIKKVKSELVGSISQLNTKDLNVDRPIESFDKLLEGKVAGVQVEYTGGGEAGLPVSVRIRGQGTLLARSTSQRATSSEPLYILDGVPLYDIAVSTSYNEATINEQRLNPLAALNPQDIESITVLKDAAASAIYGANAANGVILITTKKGESNELKIDFNYSHGVSQAINSMKWLSAEEYVMLSKETYINSGYTEEEATLEAGNADVNTNWNDLIMRNALLQSASLSLSGGSSKVKSRSSIFYKKQESISKGNDFENFGGKTGIQVTFSDKLKMNYNMLLSMHKKNGLNVFSYAQAPPNISPYNSDGSFNTSNYFENLPNPLAVLAQNENYHKGLSSNGNIQLSYSPINNLTFSALAGLDYYRNRHTIYKSANNNTGSNFGGNLNIVDRQNLQWISNFKAHWSGNFNEKHHLTALAGMELREQTTEVLRGYGSDFMYEDLHTLSSASTNTSKSFQEINSAVSYFGELSYDYKMKYIVALNMRNDASSVFGGDVRNANFASIGFSWNVSKEDFLKDNNLLSLLKLRSSYGSTGNSKIGTYAAKGTYRIDTDYAYGGTIGIIPYSAENTKLTWEKNLKYNFGVDMQFFHQLDFTVEYYQNNIKDAITSINSPYENGFSYVDINYADLRNSGWEFSLGASIIDKNDFTWSANANLSFNKNIITQLKLDQELITLTTGIGYIVGEDTRTIYGLRYGGVNPETGFKRWYNKEGSLLDEVITSTGNINYYDQEGNLLDTFNGSDNLVPIGTKSPKLYGGITQNIHYKNFSLSIFTSYSYGSDITLSNRLWESDGESMGTYNQSVNQLDRWQQPGDITNVPLLSKNHRQLNSYITSNSVFDNDYLKLQNVSLSYRLPISITKKLHITSCQFYVQGSNIGYIYFSKAKPNRNGIAEYKYSFPENRTFTTGINLSF